MTSGENFLAALKAEKPLQIAGVINAYAALLAERAGFRALYLSGAGVANQCYGLPDTGDTDLNEVLTEVHRIVRRVDLPLLVDIDTGLGNPTIATHSIAGAGAAAVQIEDQIPAKLCGHLPGKQLVSHRRDGHARPGRGQRPAPGFCDHGPHRRRVGRGSARRHRPRPSLLLPPAPT